MAVRHSMTMQALFGDDTLSRARAGDAEAFADLCAPHHIRAYNLALRLLGEPESASSVCQDAYVSAFASLGGLRDDTPFSTWLLRIVHRRCLAHLRRNGRRGDRGPRPREDVNLRSEGAPGSPGALLLRALMQLRPCHRSAVVLRDVLGLSPEDAAIVAGVGVARLWARLNRARCELARVLREGKPAAPGPGGGTREPPVEEVQAPAYRGLRLGGGRCG